MIGCSLCGSETMDRFNGLCFECAMRKESLKDRYPKLSETIDNCFGCGYFSQVLNNISVPILILEELCSHPKETFKGFPSCWINESEFGLDKDDYWAFKKKMEK